MKYRALMLDYDGTIAPISSRPDLPSQKVAQAIHQANKRLYVCLVTARAFNDFKHMNSKLKLTSYCALLNGAQIITAKNLKTTWTQTISAESITKIYRIGKTYGLKMYAADVKSDFTVTSLKQVIKKPIPDIYFDGIDKKQAKNIEKIEKELSAISDISIHRITGNHGKLRGISISDIHSSKQHAITYIAKKLKIKTDSIIGVGDGPNDYPLLMASGLKIAMGNAVPELKAIADFVAPSVEDDGVATVIEKLILS